MRREIEELQFIAGGRSDVSDFIPAAGNRMQQKSQRRRAAGQVQQ